MIELATDVGAVWCILVGGAIIVWRQRLSLALARRRDQSVPPHGTKRVLMFIGIFAVVLGIGIFLARLFPQMQYLILTLTIVADVGTAIVGALMIRATIKAARARI